MVKYFLNNRYSFVIRLFVIVCAVLALPGSEVLAETREVCAVDCAYATIQSAIDASVDGDVISVKNGTYAEAVRVNKQISIIGESRDGVIIDSSGHTGYAISVTASNVVLRFFTVQNGNHYGIKVSGVNNITLQYVTVNQMARSGVDLNGVDTAVLDGIRSTSAVAGVGIAISDSRNITMNDIVTSGNAWGGIGIFTLGEFYPGGVDNVTLTGLNSLQENPPIYVELENFTTPSEPYPATNLNLGEFVYLVTNSSQPNLSAYYTTFVQARATIIFIGAQNFAAIQNVVTGDYLVSPGLKLYAAVDLAAENSRIFAYNGEYLEPQIIVDKNITIMGESRAGVIIKPLNDTGSTGDAKGWFVINPGVQLDLSTLTLDGVGKNIDQAIRSFGSGTIQNVTFKNISYPGYQGTALANLGQNMTIINNTFSNIGRTGVLVLSSGVNDTLISGNTYTGKGDGDWLDFAVVVDGGAAVTIEEFTISGNSGEALDGTTSAGVLVTTQNAAGTRAHLTGNAIHGCADAVRVGNDPTDTSVVVSHYNDFSGNENGIVTTGSPVDAWLNWWGDASGPGGVGPGSGDGVSTAVNYSPWLGFLPGITPMTLHTNDSIQTAIDAAHAGDSIYVHPGFYDEIAENRYLYDGSGPYQFGLFVPADKSNLSIMGVDTNGVPVSSYAGVLAQVQLNATNDFGPSGLFVEADQVYVSGLELSQHPDHREKTIEVLGDAFTIRYAQINAYGSTAIAFDDWRFDEGTDSSYIEAYSLNQNLINDGTVVLTNGAGYSGSTTDRLITNNVFDGSALQFTGTIAGSSDYLYPVGGAILYGNQFSGTLEHIVARGDYDNSQFNWADYWNENTFDKAVIVGANPPESVRSYVDGIYPNSRRIGSVIQAEINHALADDTVLVKDGLYEENLIINQNISLIGQGENTVILAPALIPTCFSVANPTYNAHPVVCVRAANVTIDQFTVDGAGRGSGNYKFMGIAYQNAGGAVKNTVIARIKSTPITMEDNGLALFVYNNNGVNRSFTVDQVRIEDFQKNAMAISAIEGTALTVNISNNEILGQGHTTLVVQNGIQVWGDLLTGKIENNTVDGIGFISVDPTKKLVATSILNYYADVDVLGNTVTGAQTGLYVYDGSGRYIDNQFEVFKVGYSGFGMILTDPPGAVPSPSAVEAIEKESLMLDTTAKSDTENIIFAENNQVLFNGTDNAGTIGIDAEDGHGTKNVNVNINANTVQGFDFGITLLQCSSNCQPGVFTHLQALCNLISDNNKGMYSNVAELEMIAPYNWWGDASGPFHPSLNPDGLGNSVTGLINFTPWLEEPVCQVEFPPSARGDVYDDAVQNITYQVAVPGVLANDMDLNDDPITAVLVDDVQFGELTLRPDGSFTYVPDVNFTGSDHFTYYATDGNLNSEIVTASITVLPGIPVTSGGKIYLPIVVR